MSAGAREAVAVVVTYLARPALKVALRTTLRTASLSRPSTHPPRYLRQHRDNGGARERVTRFEGPDSTSGWIALGRLRMSRVGGVGMPILQVPYQIGVPEAAQLDGHDQTNEKPTGNVWLRSGRASRRTCLGAELA